MGILRLCNSCIVYECKTKDVHSRGPSNINLGLFVYSFDAYQVSSAFPSINYDWRKSSWMSCQKWFLNEENLINNVTFTATGYQY